MSKGNILIIIGQQAMEDGKISNRKPQPLCVTQVSIKGKYRGTACDTCCAQDSLSNLYFIIENVSPGLSLYHRLHLHFPCLLTNHHHSTLRQTQWNFQNIKDYSFIVSESHKIFKHWLNFKRTSQNSINLLIFRGVYLTSCQPE